MSKNKVSNSVSGNPASVVYLFFTPIIQDLEGKILTFIDASLQDPIQRKALKDLVRPAIWSWAVEGNLADSYDIEIKSSVKDGITSAL